MCVTPRHAVLIGCACLLAAWLATAAGARRSSDLTDARIQVTAPSRGIDPIVHEVRTQSERLADRLRSAPAPAEPMRNPFTFAPVRGRPDARPRAREAEDREVDSASAARRPTVRLIGIAEHQGTNGVVRTAILSAPDGPLLVREGDIVEDVFQVDAIDAEAVRLADVATGAARRLRLK